MVFPIHRLRKDFPALNQLVHGKPLVYLDNAATTHKPQSVIDVINRYYAMENSNVHRGVHHLSEQATFAFEKARGQLKRFINAASEKEVIFTSGATDSINLVASTFGEMKVKEGDEVVISAMEHHSNIVPWQALCERKGAFLRVIPMNDRGELLMDEYEKLLNERTRLVCVVHVSNSLGTINPVKEMIASAHARGIPVLVDGAQAVSHIKVDVRDMDADFYAVSAHKIFGPTGTGFLYGKESILSTLPPYRYGGDMIKSVTFEKTLYQDLPYRFEAGTPHIAGVIGFGAAIDYFEKLNHADVAQYETELLNTATEALSAIDGVRLIGTAAKKTAVLSFLIEGAHAHDVGTIMDREGIAIRTGHHCCQPVMKHYGVPATARASFAFYNTEEEIDALIRGVHKVKEIFH